MSPLNPSLNKVGAIGDWSTDDVDYDPLIHWQLKHGHMTGTHRQPGVPGSPSLQERWVARAEETSGDIQGRMAERASVRLDSAEAALLTRLGSW